MLERLHKAIKDPLSVVEKDMASESDARMLNSILKHFQCILYYFCETHTKWLQGRLLNEHIKVST